MTAGPSAPPVDGPASAGAPSPVLAARGAAVAFGDRVLWSGLDLDLVPGEFLAVLGPNGAGKSTFLKAALGQQRLTAGSLSVTGGAGYVPQQRSMDAATPLRARDLVGLGLDGARWGIGRRSAADRRRIADALEQVGASGYADAPIGLLSGGEQQRVRIAQALATDPQLLLCDEPLLSLDLRHQRAVSEMIDRRRREHGTAVVFVTHEINPVLGMVDRVLYIANGQHRLGAMHEVMTSRTLTELYGTPVDVLEVQGRLVVVGTPDQPGGCEHTDHPEPSGASAARRTA